MVSDSNKTSSGMVTRARERIEGTATGLPKDDKGTWLQTHDNSEQIILRSWTGPDVRLHLEALKKRGRDGTLEGRRLERGRSSNCGIF